MIRLGMLMNPISRIKIDKDTSFAMLLEAERRDWENYYMEAQDVWLQDGIAWGRMRRIKVMDDPNHWYDLQSAIEQPLVDLDVLLMRKDPPFNMQYVFLTYLLEQAVAQGLFVINDPSSLRDANEKLFTSWFPQCCPKTIVTAQIEQIKAFVADVEVAVIKPLHEMGGHSVFQLRENDPNFFVIIENLTHRGTRLVLLQQFIPAIKDGDKRIILIDGEPVPYALARIPAEGDFRGNITSGAIGEGRELSERDYWICEQVGPTLREKGLLFVGLDVIGDYLTEINVTSPTCVRQLDEIFNLNICGELMKVIANRLGL